VRKLTKATKPGKDVPANLKRVDPAAVLTITIHLIEIVAVAVVVLLYLLIKIWRRI
jgi:hypothetical protein